MKMAKKFLAVALAGVLALSVLTGCGNSANTKSIAEAMSDISKAAGITFKEDAKLNTRQRLSLRHWLARLIPRHSLIMRNRRLRRQRSWPSWAIPTKSSSFGSL